MRYIPASSDRRRDGKILVLLAVALPAIFGIVGLVVDTGQMMTEHRRLQQIADAAATAAARQLQLGNSSSAARTAATTLVNQTNSLTDATVQVNIPPATGPYAGVSGYAEVTVSRTLSTAFMHLAHASKSQTVRGRSVSGTEDSTAGGAVVILDPNPPSLQLNLGLIALTLPQLQLGGLEVLGLGRLKVDGGVFVNTEWGGKDENGTNVGNCNSLYKSATCTPVLALTKVMAADIRVNGGVDNPKNYGNIISGASSPLTANRVPVPDPLKSLPVPTTAVDATNVSNVLRGHVNVITIPLIGSTTLQPGVYESIQVTLGQVTFQPGVYIIRNRNAITGIPLALLGGTVIADGVCFYITDSSGYSAVSGSPDQSDGETVPPSPAVTNVVPSVVINGLLPGSRLVGLHNTSSPFNGMLIYQRRYLRKPIVIAATQLLGSSEISGTIYGKWGELVFVGQGTYNLRFATGTASFVNILDTTFHPTTLFPAAQVVYLVE